MSKNVYTYLLFKPVTLTLTLETAYYTNKNRLNRVMLPEKVLDTGKYKKMNKGQKLKN
jgi:hypothetical protein